MSPTASPEALDPARLMKGFPPPPPYRVHIGNWQHNPQKIWSFRHADELFPTRSLKARGPLCPLPVASQDSLEHLAVGTPDLPMTWPRMLAAVHADAALVLHRGRIIDERYRNGMQPHEAHLMMSATKSMVGLMAATAVAEGQLDEQQRVAALLPELDSSAWAGATVRQVLDMTDGVRFTEVYTDPASDIFTYIAAMGWLPAEHRKPGEPFGIQAMLGRLQQLESGPRGSAFRYRSPATDVAAWLAMRACGLSFTAWLQQRLWDTLGMEHDGHVMLDPTGTEVAFAGMSASLRDVARIGLLLAQRGCWEGRQLIPERVVEQLVRGGSSQAFEAAGMSGYRPGWSYRDQWWVNPQEPRSFAAMGAFGQRLFVFPEQALVVAFFGSHPQPIAELIDRPQLHALRCLVEHLVRTA